MAQASDLQVQQYANERIRVRAEQVRALLNAITDDKNAIGDVYERCNVQGGGTPWSDDRTDGPPKLLDQDDVLAFNTFISDLIAHIEADQQWPAVRAACVRPVNS
jgi:hypothetical protein